MARKRTPSKPTHKTKAEPAGRGTSGANRGEVGGQHQPGDPTERPIYKALLALGRDDKTLTASAIRKYEALLDAPEIRRRTGGNADPEVRAKAVERLLRTHVDGIAQELPKLVAQAALCTEKQYVGRRVGERQALLEKLSNRIKPDMFKYYRKPLLMAIEAELNYEPPAKVGVQSLVSGEGWGWVAAGVGGEHLGEVGEHGAAL